MKVFVCFDDTRDAAASFDQVGMVNSTWNAVYIHQAEYASAKKDGEADTDEKTSYHDGQVVLVCSFNGLSSDFTLSGLEDEVRMLAQSFGDLLAFREFESDGGKWRYRAEYHKISAAKEAMGSIKGHKIGVSVFTIQLISRFLILTKLSQKWIVNTEELPDYTTVVVSTPSKDNQEAVAEYMSPTGRTTWRSDEHGNQISAMPATLVPKCYGAPVGTMLTPQSTRHRSDPHGYPHTPASHFGSVGFTPRSASFPNHRQRRTFEATPSCQEDPMTPENVNNIDKSRILNGQDVRTTVMFRNIYNWYTVHDIKRLLNEHCPGVYNFVYLRIDYSTGTNMGYCFVNFTDPLCVAAFMDKFEGAEWPQDSAPNQRLVRRNPRAAGFSHASIQGLDCLIEKFRNSSVLDEAPDYRPKLIYSNEDAPMPSMVGMEYNFPPPNNPSKLGRSRDNATQVGLYEPGHRKGRFSGMFGRRSQFDRGTTSQMREDAFYNMMQPPLGYNPAYMHMPGPVPMVPPPAFGGMYQHPVNNGYVHGGPVMPAPEYASTPFREPFRNPFSNANIGSPTPRGGHWRSGGRRNNTWVHPGRDEETADREIAEQRANDMYEVNMGRAPPPAHLQHQYNCYQVPRIAEADEAEQHPAVVNYSAYTNNHVNGNGAYGGNGYAVNGNGANGYTANGDNGNGFGYNSYYQQY